MNNPKNGLNNKELKQFSELLIKANLGQIAMMTEELGREMMRRKIENYSLYCLKRKNEINQKESAVKK